MRCTSRALVLVRRAQRSPPARILRRAGKIAGRALVFGVGPSVASDSILDHKIMNYAVLSHETAQAMLAAVASTSVHDLVLLIRALRL